MWSVGGIEKAECDKGFSHLVGCYVWEYTVYLKLISPSIKPKLDFSLKNISPVAVSLVKIQRSDSFQVQLTRILPAGISMVSVPPNLRALALSVQDVRNAIAVIAMTKIFFMVLCDRIYGRVSYKVQI